MRNDNALCELGTTATSSRRLRACRHRPGERIVNGAVTALRNRSWPVTGEPANNKRRGGRVPVSRQSQAAVDPGASSPAWWRRAGDEGRDGSQVKPSESRLLRQCNLHLLVTALRTRAFLPGRRGRGPHGSAHSAAFCSDAISKLERAARACCVRVQKSFGCCAVFLGGP